MNGIRSGNPRSKTATLGAFALILLAIVGFSYREWRQYAAANIETAQSTQIRETVDNLLAGLLDAETGQRGFLLTGMEQYLESYSQATVAVPEELANLKKLLSSNPEELKQLDALNTLIDQKLSEISRTIEVRRTRGELAALEIIRSGEGKETMDEIRRMCSGLDRREHERLSAAALSREGAALSALLITIAGSLLLLFFFAARVEPTLSLGDPQVKPQSRMLAYGAAIAATLAAALIRKALTPLMGETELPFIIFFPAVAFSAWYGGFRTASVSLVLSALLADYYFIAPVGTLLGPDPGNRIGLLVFLIAGFGIALLGHSQRRGVQLANQEATRRKRAEDAEREQRRRFEATLRSVGDAVIATDAQGRVVFANQAAKNLTRRTAQTLEGERFEDLFPTIDATTRAPVESPVARVMREGNIVRLASPTMLRAADGTEIPIDESGAPMRNEEGVIEGTVLVFRDITDRRRAEMALRQSAEELRRANEALMQSNEDLERFTSVASHDLREPLRMIGIYAQLLLEQSPNMDEKQRMFAKQILEGADRMRELIADLLTYAGLRADQENPAEIVDLNDILENAKSNLKASIDETQAAITSDPLPKVRAHSTHFTAIFQNLIGNAIKYRSQCPVQIHVSTERTCEELVFAVRDNGLGIDPKYHDMIFLPFKRLHGRKISGTGIGLAICQRVVQRYGGRIWVESEIGKGSVFRFTLPANIAE